MCTNKRFIYNPYINRHILVNCGRCPACLQQKAVARTNRINNNKSLDGSELPLFVTLTYSNDYIPYIKESDILTSERFLVDSDKQLFSYDVPIYRNFNVRHYKGRPFRSPSLSPFDVLTLDDSFKPYGLRYLKGQDNKYIGICYYPDLQNFIKRLRINLHRNGFQNNFSFYACSEYGPTTTRPHFHLLIQSCEKDVNMWKRAVSQAWPFDSGHATQRNVEVARKGSSYVSSYVNCFSSLPLFYQQPALKPKHSYSKGFGVGQDVFSLSSLLQKIDVGDLHYVSKRIVKGVSVDTPLLMPKYVINRYFPKFMGYSRLVGNALFSILERPSTYSAYARLTGATVEQIHQVKTSLLNAAKRFSSSIEFAYYYIRVWNLYNSSLIIDNLATIKDYQSNIYAYDNISSYVSGIVKSVNLDSIRSFLDLSVSLNPNDFPKEQMKTSNLISAFASYSKDRKVRNYIYQNLQNV